MQAEFEDYKSFLRCMAQSGRGVFCITMLESPKYRHALKMFIYRHSSFFTELKGTHGDVKLLRISSEGNKYFGIKPKQCRAISSWESLLDLSLIHI